MNIQVRGLTACDTDARERELALSAAQRHKEFRRKIAEKAEALKAEPEIREIVPDIKPPRQELGILRKPLPFESASPESIWPWPHPLEDRRGSLSILEIQGEVAKYFKISVIELTCQRRTLPITRIRQIACYLCRTLTTFSLPVIAKKFGGRDHTTILHAANKIASLMLKDADLAHDVALLIEQITGKQQ